MNGPMAFYMRLNQMHQKVHTQGKMRVYKSTKLWTYLNIYGLFIDFAKSPDCWRKKKRMQYKSPKLWTYLNIYGRFL